MSKQEEFDLRHLALLPIKKPLIKSHEVDNFETELKALMLELAKQFYSERLFDANVIGAAYLGSLDIVRRSIINDGLTVIRSIGDEATNHYLLKSWLSKNSQQRGLEFLESYLQLQFPNSAAVTQLWHEYGFEYPSALKNISNKSSDWLTSRIFIEISIDKLLEFSKSSVAPAKALISELRRDVINIIPARLVPIAYYGIDIDTCEKLLGLPPILERLGEGVHIYGNLVNCGEVPVTPFLMDSEFTCLYPDTTSELIGRCHIGKMVLSDGMVTSIYPKTYHAQLT